MQPYDLSEAIADLEAVEEFIRELAAREEEIAIFGFRRISTWESFVRAEPVLADFASRLYDLLELARATDRSASEAMVNIADGTKLGSSLGKVYVVLKLETRRRPLPSHQLFASLRSVFSYILPLSPRRLFVGSEMDLHGVLVSLHTFIPLAKRVQRIALDRYLVDDEIFKPSNVDRTVVIQLIENAIIEVRSGGLESGEKDRLLEYLERTKLELASTNASWKKVVGALVIVAALISGMSDAAGAYENVSKAIQLILGTSIEKHVPSRLPTFPDDGGILISSK